MVISKKQRNIFKKVIAYIKDNKILSTLTKENNICVKTLKNYIKSLEIAKPTRLNLKEIILLIDATYWGTSFGVVVFIRL